MVSHMSAAPQLAAALRLLRCLRGEGYEAYLAGGCVRDLLLGREPSDYDVATSATPDVVLDLFPRTFAVGAHFGVVLVSQACSQEDATESGPSEVAQVVTEVATFRSDGVYSDGRHPDAVRYTLSAEEDVRRRDFTINGLLFDPLVLLDECAGNGANSSQVPKSEGPTPQRRRPVVGDPGPGAPADLLAQSVDDVDAFAPPLQGSGIVDGLSSQGSAALHSGLFSRGPSGAFPAWAELLDDKERIRAAVIDYVGGLADLDAGVVRAIGRAEARFEEDHLRMLRAVRFVARFGFDLDPATAAAIRSLAPRIASVSRERVRDELTKMLTEGHARRAFELLLETGLLAEVLPEAVKMVGVEQPPQFHPEGDVWTHVLLLLDQLEPGCPMSLGWGALLHDIGKPATFRRAVDRIRFDGHVEVGVAIAADICRRFRFSNDEARQILALVENHMRFMDAQRMKTSTLKRFFRLDHFEQHLALHRMDCLASKGGLENWEYMRERWQQMPADAVRPQLLVTGRELIAVGYLPGAAFKTMLHAAEEAQLEGSIATAVEAMELVRERFGPPSNPAPQAIDPTQN